MEEKEEKIEEKPKKKHKALKVILITLGSILGVFILCIALYNGIKYPLFSDFYSITEKVRKNPGLNDGYITQGMCYLEDKDMFITSGYMTDKSKPSRIYSVDKDNNTHYCELYKMENGEKKKVTNHCGGVSREEDKIYLAVANKIYIYNTDDVLNNSEAILVNEVSVNTASSFVYTNGSYLFSGEFHNGTSYVTEHPFTNTDGETTYAIVSQYELSSFESENPKIVKEFAIRNKVQGFCVTDSGTIVMDTSYGPAPSNYYIYSGDFKADTYDEDIPVTYLDSRYLTKEFKGPSMAEDLDYCNGKVYVTGESASNKYIFGKLLFYWYIYGLKIN